MNRFSYTRLTPFKWFTLENFPFIEADFDAMTEWQLFCKIGKEINKIINSQNAVGSQFENVINAFIELQDYINNYFDNLNVQDEIDNKLNEMAEDGTLDNILNSYVNTIKIMSTTSEMLLDETLVSGQKIKTLGYYNINDGGGAEFIITDTENNTEYQLELQNDLYATMIINDDTLDFRQLGAKSDDTTFDNKNILLNYVSICNKLSKTLKLVISEGKWYFSPTHICRIGGVNIQGISGFPARGYTGAVICSIADNQNYIWKFGGVEDMNDTQLAYTNTNTSNIIKNLTFSTGDYKVTYGCLVLEYANYGVYEDLYFTDIVGTGLYIRSSWENYFSRLNFRSIQDFSKPKLYFAQARTIASVSANISSSSFDYLMFENCCGNLIQSDVRSNLLNNQFGEINIENSYNTVRPGEVAYNITQDTDLSAMTPLFVFFGVGFDNTFNTINYTGLTARQKYYNSVENVNYYFQGIFGVPSSSDAVEGNIFNNIVNNIFLRRDCTILTTNTIFINAFKFSCANIISSTKITKKFELNDGCGQINIQNFSDRDTTSNTANTHAMMLNSIDLYKYGVNGSINYDDTAINDLGLVMKKPSNSTTLLTKLYYPFALSETTKRQFDIRVKGSGNFTVRGLVNGSNSNKVYTLADSNDWQTITIDMNYDLFSPITIISSAENIEFDTLSYNREVAVA